MDERKAVIRRSIRAARRDRRQGTDEAARTREKAALLSRWWEVLDLLGLDGRSPHFLPALFVPTPTEADVSAILSAHPRSLLPVLVDDAGHSLEGPAWALWAADSGLVSPSPRRPGQPSGPRLGAEALREADVVLVAALAVDEGGSRLGQGGGWYDRALLGVGPGVPVIAAVFDEEVMVAGALPREPHDRAVDAAIAPGGVHLLT